MRPLLLIRWAFPVVLWGIGAILLPASSAVAATSIPVAPVPTPTPVAPGGAFLGTPTCLDTSEFDAEWIELAPPVRRDHSAILDPVGDRMLVFGGGQMWGLGLGAGGWWSRVNPEGAPPPGGLAIYDPVRQRMLVGSGASLWSLSLGADAAWKTLPTSGSPPDYLALLYDPVRDRLLAFTAQLEVWQLLLVCPLEWTALPTSAAPAGPRTGFSVIHDKARDQVLVYGGYVHMPPPCDEHLMAVNEVWTLSLAAGSMWQQLSLPSGPSTGQHSAIYDPVRDRMVIFGGHDWILYHCGITPDCNWDCFQEPAFNEVGCWALSLSPEPTWTKLVTVDEPHDRAGHSAVYDPVRDRMVICGGWYDNYVDWSNQPTFDFSDATSLVFDADSSWQSVAVGAPPEHISGSRAAYDPSNRRMLVHGGYGNLYRYGQYGIGDRVSYDLKAETVTGGNPYMRPWRLGGSIVLDVGRNHLVLFGGMDKPYVGIPGDLANDTWVADLDFGTPWEELWPTGIPPAARWGHSAVFDPLTDQMFVVGGDPYYGQDPDRSLWSLKFGPVPEWTQRFSTSPFGLNGYPTVVLDADCRRLIFIGDLGAGDVWMLPLDPIGVWAHLSTTGTGPNSGTAIEAIFDPHRHRVVVNREWALSLGSAPTWSRLQILGTGPTQPWELLSGAAIYDPVGDRLVVCTDGATSFWALRFTPPEPAAVGPSRIPTAALRLSSPSPNPTRGSSRFVLELAEPADVSLDVFDTQGRRVAALASRSFSAGLHSLSWDGSAAGGEPAAAGLYFLRARSVAATSVRRLLLLP